VTLLSQTPWIDGHGVFRLHLLVSARDPSKDTLDIMTFLRVLTRTDFDNAIVGKYDSVTWYDRYLPIDTLTPDPSGAGIDVDIPVNQPSTGSQQPTFEAQAGSAVFPIQIAVRDPNGIVEGKAFTTFLVWAAGPPAVTSYPRLLVTVMLPVTSPAEITAKSSLGPPVTPESQRLYSLGSALAANPTVPVTLETVPQTLDALRSGSVTDKATLAHLSAAVAHGSEVLPSTFSGVPVGDLVEAGLPYEADRQLSTGARVHASLLGAATGSNTWAVPGAVSGGDVAALLDRGMTGLILPDSDMSTLPPASTYTTFALSTRLDFPGAQGLTVMAADPGITQDFARAEPPVLAANQLLSELAMIQLETPGLLRGVVVAPPSGWTTSGVFYSTVLAGLAKNPLLSAVTATGLLSQVPHSGISRGLTDADPDAGAESALATDATDIHYARNELSGIAEITPRAAGEVAGLEQRLFVAESTGITELQRQLLLASIGTVSTAVTRQIVLPGSSSITLTSTRASIPVTILSAPSLRARVRLTLDSQRLIFQNYQPPHGTCTLTSPSSEVCNLTLVNENTTLAVPVQTRASGVFPLDVSLYSADGSLLLAHDEDTIRSTAVSGVGIALICLTVVSLAIWWIRDLRRGRRARSLVPAPIADGEPPGLAGFSVPNH
jgi:hypothetical protein